VRLNGNSAHSASDLRGQKNPSDYDHDKQREKEAMQAAEHGNFKAARRAAGHIRGNKERLRVDKTLDDLEAEWRVQP
jgi:hypothetical protein